MKLHFYFLPFLLLPLCGCAPQNEEPSWKEDVFAMTAHFMPSSEEGVKEAYHCYLANSVNVIYQDEEGKGVHFDFADWGIDQSALIPGDAVVFTNNAKEIYFACTDPSRLDIFGQVRSVEVIPCAIYEARIAKEGDRIEVGLKENADIPFALPKNKDGYSLSKEGKTVVKKDFASYEDGETTLYYAYNPALKKPLDYTCLFDYDPRAK